MRKIKENFVDHVVNYFSPRRAFIRKQFRFAYDVLDKSRTRKKRGRKEGTGDTFLTKANLDNLRGICRDLGRNNPIAKGILNTEANGVVGSDTVIQAKTQDEVWNAVAEELWREEMLNNPCDITGRFGFHKLLHKAFMTYRRDGDMFVIFTDYGLQMVEGEQCGSPYGINGPKHYDIVNGVAISKLTKKVLGYYIGRASKWGYIESGSYKKYQADEVYHFINPERFSNCRGTPVLTPSVDYIDKLTGYIDAELVAARVNACLSIYITSEQKSAMPGGYTGGVATNGEDPDTGEKLDRIAPGMIEYLNNGEAINPVIPTRPPSAFDPFTSKLLGFIGRPLCLPMMLVTLDFKGVTNVNARLIFSEARDNWTNEQKFVVMPFVRKVWRWKIDEWIRRGVLEDRPDKYKSEIFLKRWQYVDPFKEANADRLKLEAGTTSRTIICARGGRDWKDIIAEREQEEKLIAEKKIVLKPGQAKPEEK